MTRRDAHQRELDQIADEAARRAKNARNHSRSTTNHWPFYARSGISGSGGPPGAGNTESALIKSPLAVEQS